MPSQDYSGRRKTKNDKRAKRRFKIYKIGGSQRSTNIKLTNEKPDN
jgi:hypothetical protein